MSDRLWLGEDGQRNYQQRGQLRHKEGSHRKKYMTRRTNSRLTSLGPGESTRPRQRTALAVEETGFDIGGVHVPAIGHGCA
jgi:hypothetical protein